jgi:hypothetical protein
LVRSQLGGNFRVDGGRPGMGNLTASKLQLRRFCDWAALGRFEMSLRVLAMGALIGLTALATNSPAFATFIFNFDEYGNATYTDQTFDSDGNLVITAGTSS